MDHAETAAILALAYTWIAISGIVVYVYYGFALSAIFRKAGLKAWPAWVPIFTSWRVLELGGQKGWWILIALIPFVGPILYLIFLIVAGIKIQTAFGKPGVFYLLAILVTPVWYGILAWDSSRWNPSHEVLVPQTGYATS